MEQVDELVCVDEADFVLLIPNLGDDSSSAACDNLKRDLFRAVFLVLGDSVSLTLSIGKVLVDSESTTDKPLTKESSTKDFSDLMRFWTWQNSRGETE